MELDLQKILRYTNLNVHLGTVKIRVLVEYWILDRTCYHRTPLCQICILNYDILQAPVLAVFNTIKYLPMLTHFGDI